MKTPNVRKQLLTVAVGAALSLGAVSQASAVTAPLFTYDFDGLPGGTTVVANSMGGGSSELLNVSVPGSQFTGSGWVQFDALKLNSSTVAGTSYLDTGLYAKFSLTATLATGTFGASGSTYTIAPLTYALWYDVARNNTFTQADASGAIPIGATVGSTIEDLLLATGIGIFGDAGLHSTFGASINELSTFTLTADGMDHFIVPDPFYTKAFEGFNSTGGAWFFNTTTGALSIANATGISDFVPEPGSLALLGLGLAGLSGFTRRRRNQAA